MAGGDAIGTPQECDLFRSRGDTKDFSILVTGQDVTGWTGLLTITTVKDPKFSPVDVIYQATGAPDPASPADAEVLSRIIFDFSDFDAQSPQLVPGKFFYDIQLTDTAFKDCTVLEGKYEIGQDRTK